MGRSAIRPQTAGVRRTSGEEPRSTKLRSMAIRTPPYVARTSSAYWCTRRSSFHRGALTYLRQDTSRRPFAHANQTRSGAVKRELPRSRPSAAMPALTLE